MVDFCRFLLRHKTNISLSDEAYRRKMGISTSTHGICEKEGGAKVIKREGLMAVDFCLPITSTFDDLSLSPQLRLAIENVDSIIRRGAKVTEIGGI